MSTLCKLPEPGFTGLSFISCPPGTISRRQWWFGHAATALLISFGFIGGGGVVLALAAGLGVDPAGGSGRMIALAVAAACLWRFVGTSAVLSRRRLGAGSPAGWLVDGVAVLGYLAIPVVLDDMGLMQSGSAWPLPTLPHWIAASMAAVLAVGFAATALECGVFAGPERSTF